MNTKTRGRIAVIVTVLVAVASVAAQAVVWDLAADWTTSTASGIANFGTWGIDGAVPGWWFNVPAYYNDRFPYNEQAYDVDAWVLQKNDYFGMIGKLLPGGSSGAYDWPVGSIAFQSSNWIGYIWFQAPSNMLVRLDASFWIAGDSNYEGRFAMNLDRALGNPGDGAGPGQAGATGYVGANPNVDGSIMPSNILIPSSATSASPFDIRSISGWGTSYNINPDAIQMYTGDRLGIWFYEPGLAQSPLIGINFSVTEVQDLPTAATPAFTPDGGSYSAPVTVTMTCATALAEIRYTTNGADPTMSSALYKNPVLIDQNLTLKARAWASGYNPSVIKSAQYTFAQVDPPAFTPDNGTYTGPQSVTISSAPGATIRYTTDGSDPTESSSVYIGPVPVSQSLTLKAKAWKTGANPSGISNAVYNIVSPVWDLATDWTLAGNPFGPDKAWEASDLGPTYPMDIMNQWTSSNPWVNWSDNLYNIDGWSKNGRNQTPYKPMYGKNIGGGNIPGTVNGTYYDWPVGKIACGNYADSAHALWSPTILWQAPRDMVVSLSGSCWTIGRYADISARRSRFSLQLDRASNGYTIGSDPLGWVLGNNLVPLWTEGYDSSTPKTFASIGGSTFSNIQVYAGDRLYFWTYWDGSATKDGVIGVDMTVTTVSEAPAIPRFTPDGGTYIGQQYVTMFCPTSGATIRYATDGSDPTEASAEYFEPITVSQSLTLKARAFKTGYAPSALKSATYTIAPPPTKATISQAKTWADGLTAELDSVVVSSDDFGGFFYIQSEDRSTGIRVNGIVPKYSVGKKANVAGVVRTDVATAERYVDPVSINLIDGEGFEIPPHQNVIPLGLTCSAVGGSDMGLQQGVAGGTGLNNIGLLVKCWGRVALDMTNFRRFTLSDGSVASVTVEMPEGMMGPGDGVYVSVEGISSCEKVNGEVRRLIRVRDSSDVCSRAPAAGFSETVFYVATNGNDSWSGTLPAPNAQNTDGPFATLNRARTAVRSIVGSQLGIRAPISVKIRGGKYYLNSTFNLSAQDSGVQGFPVTWMAYPGETVTLSGGSKITGWTAYSGNIMQAAVPPGWKFKQLFYNGQRQIRARTPNYVPSNPVYGGWSWIVGPGDQYGATSKDFRYAWGLLPVQLAKPAQADVFVFVGPAGGFGNDIVPVTSIDYANRIIRTNYTYGGDPLLGFTSACRFRIENAIELLDQAGEWCLDSDTGKVYFWPPTPLGSDPDVAAPALDTVLMLNGVKWITISGLNITETKERSGTAAVVLQDSEYCRVERCRIDYPGYGGIRLSSTLNTNNECSNNIIKHNVIGYSGSEGIDFVYRTRHNRIIDNEVHHCGELNKYAAAISFQGMDSADCFSEWNVIGHNWVHDAPRDGISLGVNRYGRNIMEYNRVDRSCLETIDSGALRAWGDTPSWRWNPDIDPVMVGHIIRYNTAVDTPGCGGSGGQFIKPYLGYAVYLDNMTSNTLVYGNILVRAYAGYITNAAQNVDFINNIFADCGRQAIFSMAPQLYDENDHSVIDYNTGNTFTRNIFYVPTTGSTTFPCSFDPILDKTKVVSLSDYNLFYRPDGNYSGLTSWQALGFDSHSLKADPLFMDRANDDYRLQPASPAFGLGFVQINTSQIGIRE